MDIKLVESEVVDTENQENAVDVEEVVEVVLN